MTALSATGAPTLHLCHNYRQLLHALIDASRDAGPTTILYLQDDLPVPESAHASLAALCPAAHLAFMSDRAMAAEFANLPRFLPAILRRNLRVPVHGGAVPIRWRPPDFASTGFGTGYIYHPGFFSAKVFAGMCRHVVMRESGMNNYIALGVPPMKAMLRALCGLPAHRQIWGEEHWIDSIEVETPEALPAPIRHKARRVRFADVLAAAPPKLVERAVALLAPDISDVTVPPYAALILTQPIEELGLCDAESKRAVYARLAHALSERGYRVFVKNHPREAAYTLPGTVTVARGFPIETWALVQEGRFALAVALHSAALVQSGAEFAERSVQLFDGFAFAGEGIDGICRKLDAAIERHLGPV